MGNDDSNDEARNDSMSAGNSTAATVVDKPQEATDRLSQYHMRLAGGLPLLPAIALAFPWIQSDAGVQRDPFLSLRCFTTRMITKYICDNQRASFAGDIFCTTTHA